MSRPTARKSTLGTTHPAAPQQAPAATATKGSTTPRTPRPAARTKLTFYTSPEQAGQARAVLTNVPTSIHGYRNLSELINAAVDEKVQAMQETYNAGKPWPPAEPGTVPTGRPTD